MPFADEKDRLAWRAARAAERTALLIYMAGGACVVCLRRDGALEFHHRDPREKCFCISREIANVSMERLLDEAAKCDLVCAVCHQELHRVASVVAGTYVEPLDAEDLSEAFAALSNRWRA